MSNYLNNVSQNNEYKPISPCPSNSTHKLFQIITSENLKLPKKHSFSTFTKFSKKLTFFTH